MPSNKSILFWRSVIHSDPTCLFHRFRLEIKRRVQQTLPWTRPGKGEPLAVTPRPPSPLFPARSDLGGSGPEGPFAHFLNQIWPLNFPLNWRPSAAQLAVMNLHYMEYLEALDPEDLPALVHNWIKTNPAYELSFWQDRWNSYALSIRCVIWMQEIARGRLNLDKEITASLCEQVRFLTANLEIDIRGNHLVKNIKALLWAGAFFQGDEAASWTKLGLRLLDKELSRQILADGVHFELSPAYHLQVFADLLECYQLLPEHSLKPKLGETLDRMAQVAADLTHPDRLISHFSDGGLHMAYVPSACLDVYFQLRSQQVVQRPIFSFLDAGYFGARDGTDFVLVDCGPIAPDSLPAHGHGDIFSFEWSLNGKRWIIDQGVFEYKEGPIRMHSRATSSHNTLTLDGLDQCEFWKSFRVGRRARVAMQQYVTHETRFILEGSHDGYAHLPGRPIHKRLFDAGPSRISIEDSVQGGKNQRAEAHLLLHPDVRIERNGESCCNLLIGEERVILESPHPLCIQPASWYPDFGVEIPTHRILLDYGPAPCRGRFSLLKM